MGSRIRCVNLDGHLSVNYQSSSAVRPHTFTELILELASSELLPASTIFIPLPTSDLHYLIVRITTNGLIFELLRIARVPVQNGPGMKLAVDSRSSLPLRTLRQRSQDAKGKRKADVESEKAKAAVLPVIEEPEAFGSVAQWKGRSIY
jgi:hypothetical protein